MNTGIYSSSMPAAKSYTGGRHNKKAHTGKSNRKSSSKKVEFP